MASLTDVMNAIGGLAASALYPDGTGQASIAGTDITIVSGWPDANALNTALSEGKVFVSIYPVNNMERSTTRYARVWYDGPMAPITLTATVVNNTVTLGGAISTPSACMLIVNGTPYAYAIQPSDTPESIAAALAALIPGAETTGSVITITGAHSVIARINTAGTSTRPIKSQERVFMITTWAPNFALRETVSNAIEIALTAAQRMMMPDGFYAALSYRGASEQDQLQKPLIYRRDLRYAVDYTTTQTETDYTINHPFVNSITPT